MFKLVRRSAKKPRVDLQTVRETLVYMESDCRDCPGLEGVAAALEQTITEIDRVGHEQHELPQEPVAARFIPAGLT